MKIIFLKAYDFPLGGASQNRLLGICRGLGEEGHHLEVHQYSPSKLDLKLNTLKSQVYKGIRIYNHAWRWSPVKSKYAQTTGLISGIISCFFSILRSNKTEHIDYIFMNSEKNIYLFPFFIISRLISAKFGRDLNEYPLVILRPARFNKLQKKFKISTNYRWFDVVFIISKDLINYYSPYLNKRSKILNLPVTVDFDRFPFPIDSLEGVNNITYCGDLSDSKDGILILIRAFKIVRKEFPEIKLKLIGQNSDTNYMGILNRLIADLKLTAHIVFTGYVHPDKMPGELYKSRLLVLSRPENIQNRGGFPTKLGEYLATGIPVAVTSVGEIPFYLKDEINAYLAKPGNVESFADCMKRSLTDKDKALRIGLAGRKTALEYFSHKRQGKIISDFLKDKN